MPVLFHCPCGKKLCVSDDHAGKCIRCPHCAGPAPVPGPADPSTVSLSAEAVHFACPCGEQMSAKAEHGGQIVECPVCGTDVTIPLAERSRSARAGQREPARPGPTAGATSPPRKARLALDEIDATDLMRKHSLWPWALAGATLLCFLLIGGATAGWLLWSRSVKADAKAAAEAEAKKSASERPTVPPIPAPAKQKAANLGDLALVPPDAQGFVMIRVAEVWSLEATQKGLQQAREQFKAMGQGDMDFAKQMEDATGLAPGNVERATVVFADAEKEAIWFIAATNRPYDRDKALIKLKGAEERQFEGKPYHFAKIENGPAIAVYFAAPQVLVVGPEEGVKRCIQHQLAPKKRGPLDEAIEAAGTRRQMVIGFAPKVEDVKRWKKAIPQEIAGAIKPFLSLLDVEAMTLSILPSDNGLTHTHLEARFLSEAKAKEGRIALEGAKAAVSLVGVPAMEKLWVDGGTPVGAAKVAREALQRMLDNFVVEVKGRELSAALQIESKPFMGLKLKPTLPGVGVPAPPEAIRLPKE